MPALTSDRSRMMETGPPPRAAGRESTGARVWARTILPAALAGILLAVIVVYAYYNDPWRPLAHVLGPWAMLATAFAFRRTSALAIGASVASLGAAVLTFYVGLKVGHDIRWAGSGSTMSINWGDIQLWLVLAGIAGGVFGLLGSNAARRDWRGAGATAALLGLVLGDACRRLSDWEVDVAVTVDALAAVVVFTVATRVNRRPVLTLVLSVATTVAGFLVVSAPDFLEQILIEGL